MHLVRGSRAVPTSRPWVAELCGLRIRHMQPGNKAPACAGGAASHRREEGVSTATQVASLLGQSQKVIALTVIHAFAYGELIGIRSGPTRIFYPVPSATPKRINYGIYPDCPQKNNLVGKSSFVDDV